MLLIGLSPSGHVVFSTELPATDETPRSQVVQLALQSIRVSYSAEEYIWRAVQAELQMGPVTRAYLVMPLLSGRERPVERAFVLFDVADRRLPSEVRQYLPGQPIVERTVPSSRRIRVR